MQHQFDSITNIPSKNLWLSVTYSNIDQMILKMILVINQLNAQILLL